MKDNGRRYHFHTMLLLGIWFFVGVRLDEIRNIGVVTLILIQCGKAPNEFG